MAIYTEYRFWSPLMGCEAVRISTVGGTPAARFHGEAARGQEYYAVFAADVSGRVYRERRSRALDMIEEAIARGFPPSEVEVWPDETSRPVHGAKW